MKFIYNEEMTKAVVQNYFKKNEDIEGELVISCGSRKIPMCGRAFVEYDAPYVSFRLKGSMEIDGEKQPVELVVSEDEVTNAFTTLIEASGRKVKKISMDFDEKKFNCVAIEAVAKRKVKGR